MRIDQKVTTNDRQTPTPDPLVLCKGETLSMVLQPGDSLILNCAADSVLPLLVAYRGLEP